MNDINLGTQVNKVMIQSDWKYRDNIDNINELYVQNNLGRMVPMRGLVDLHKVLAPRVVERYNQYSAASITAVRPLPAVRLSVCRYSGECSSAH